MAKKELDLKALKIEWDAFKKEQQEWMTGIAENVNTKMDQISESQTEFETSLSERVSNEKASPGEEMEENDIPHNFAIFDTE